MICVGGSCNYLEVVKVFKTEIYGGSWMGL